MSDIYSLFFRADRLFVRLALTARAALHQRQRRQHQDQTGQQRQAGHRHALTDGTLFELRQINTATVCVPAGESSSEVTSSREATANTISI
ncbi:hypothetical protein K24_28760, partial [Klebsiella pneumoniae]